MRAPSEMMKVGSVVIYLLETFLHAILFIARMYLQYVTLSERRFMPIPKPRLSLPFNAGHYCVRSMLTQKKRFTNRRTSIRHFPNAQFVQAAGTFCPRTTSSTARSILSVYTRSAVRSAAVCACRAPAAPTNTGYRRMLRGPISDAEGIVPLRVLIATLLATHRAGRKVVCSVGWHGAGVATVPLDTVLVQ
jgi:hypothetical protein